MKTAQHKTVNRSATVQPAASPKVVQRKAVAATMPVSIQTSMKVSSPHDPAEKEADATAKKIMRMSVSESSGALVRTDSGGVFRQVKKEEKEKKIQTKLQSPYVTRFMASGVFTRNNKEEGIIQRRAEGLSNVASDVAANLQNSIASGSPMPVSVRRFMEPRFNVNFRDVKVHTGDKAAKLSRQLNAQAFTVGNQIYFGKDRFKPESHEGKELIAHEITHTIQQGAAIQRNEDASVTQHSPTQVQRLGLSDALDYFADKANLIPGFRMFTIVLGVNPINMSPVARSAANILRAIIELIPMGGLITQALDSSGVFEKAGKFVEQQIASLGMVGGAIKQAVTQFLDSLGWRDIFDLGGVWARAKRIFTEPIDRIISFAKGLVSGIVELVKDAILRPIAKLAEGTEGYALLKAVLGKDPITGDPVPQTAETIIGPFMKLIGQAEIWENMKKANAIGRAFAWFKGALVGLMGFVTEIPGLFINAFKSLQLADIILVPLAFGKLVKVFGGFIVRFVTWAGGTIWNLLEIIFEVVKPGALGYIKRTGAALKSILKNPIPFVGNLVKAAKLGFQNFADRFGTHLKAGLINWLTGSLPGVYIPQAFSLIEFGKFALSVFGISWAQIRGKIVKALGPTGEKIMQGLETTFDVVKALVTGGPAAAWEVIKEKLTNLKDMIVDGIIGFIKDTVIQKAIPKLIAMFIPGAGFISAIISIYDTVMVFVEKISKIIEVVKGFIDSIVAIAGGAIGAAAGKVERILAGLLSLAISFLAGFVGLGKVSDKIMGVINKVRTTVDKALDAAIAWIVDKAKKLFAKVFGKDKDKGKDPEHDAKVKKGIAQIDSLDASYAKDGKISREHAQKVAAKVKADNPVFKSIKVVEGDNTWDYDYVASPGVRYIGGPKGGGQLTVTTVKIKDPEKAAKVEEARKKGGREWELAIEAAIIKEVFVPKWEITIQVPIEILVRGQKAFDYPSAQDLARLKVQRGHRHEKDPTRFPDISMEVKKPGGGGALQEVVLVEITLVEDFTAQGDFAKHKVDQFTYTLKILKGKYGDQVQITYFFMAPRKPTTETEAFILSTLTSEGMPNVKVKWVVVKTK